MSLYLYDRHLQWLGWVRFGVDAVSQREAYMDFLDDMRRTSLDYYATLRSLYRQRRDSLVSAGKHDVEMVHDRRKPEDPPPGHDKQ